MQLRYSPTSPYVRKVSVSAIELGLADRIERILTDTMDPNSGLAEHNPLAKVPALILESGQVLYDSPVVCEYLDALHDGAKIFPPSGPGRWTALCQQALGDGILDAAILRMLETTRRPEARRWQGWIDKQAGKIARALDRLEAEAEALEGPLSIGRISIGCALGYLDFRAPDDDWRAGHPNLAAWYQDFARRPSMQETVPEAPS
ncbi:MAG: glutathione S-transferase [Kiloniellales bacterium]